MTFEDEPSEAALESPNPKARVISRIDRGLKFTPYEVVDWAKAQGFTVHYVDGAWVRVPASPEAICAFLADRVDSDDLERIRCAAGRQGHWVIEAEEF